MDFDVPGADNDRLRALEGPINVSLVRISRYALPTCRCTKRKPSAA